MDSTRKRTAGWALGLLTAGALSGAVLSALPTASAADPTPAPSASSAPTTPDGAPAPPAEGRPGRGTELTGDVAEKVEAAVLAAHPGATVQRLSTDGRGEAAYRAHITTADDERLTVLVDEAFTVVSSEPARGPGRGPGGPGGPGGCEPGEAEGAAPEDDAAPEADGASLRTA